MVTSGISIAALGLNVITAIVQPIGIINTTAVIGHKWTAKGLSRFLTMGPRAAFKFAAGKSGAFENRARTRFRELAEIQAYSESSLGRLRNNVERYAYSMIVFTQMLVDVPTWLGAYEKALSEGCVDAEAVARARLRNNVERYAYSMIVFTQMLVDVPTWLGAYEKALSEGCVDAEAVARADRAVVDAQGGGRLMDLSAVERGGPLSRIFTVFYTFFNSILNTVMVSKHTKSKMGFATDALLLLCFQPVIETFLREGIKAGVAGADPDDWWEKSVEEAPWSVLDFNLGLFVFLREFSGITDSYTGPSGMKKFQDVRRFAQQVEQGDFDMAFWKSLTNMTGAIFGLPAAPITRAMTGIDALERGKTDNPLAVIFGYSEY